jgi:hypothetical protein
MKSPCLEFFMNLALDVQCLHGIGEIIWQAEHMKMEV